MDRLVAIAVIASISIGQYEIAILVPLLFALGHFLEERSVLGAQAAIEGLRKLRAREATLILSDGSEQSVAVESLKIGDEVLVRPGDVIPADGTVVRGQSAIDQSAVTGETVPEDVSPGDAVYAGTINVSGLIRVQVTHTGEATAIGKVLDTLREAERSKAPIMQVLERYAGYYMPFVLLIALATVLLTRDVNRAVALLVVACPCAIVLAGSTAMVASLAVASRLGILIKNTRFLEVLGDVKTVILDKTGTVTLGQLDVVGVHLIGTVSEQDLMSCAAACAYGSRHPISRAVARECHAEGIPACEEIDFTEHPGKGMEVQLDGSSLKLGSASWLKVGAKDQSAIHDHVGPVVWAKRDNQLLGAILLADRPRPEAREALDSLRAMGVRRIVLLTGDRQEVACEMAAYLGVDDYRAEMLPTAKLAVVEQEASSGQRVLVVGDGVNDAPALARADVGVAMGAMGSDIAIQSADIALMSNDIRRIGTAIRLARVTRHAITINIAIGIGSALLMITLASAGYVGAVWGALLHNISAAIVLINSARILRTDLDQ
jgi:Cd2+/Zn2+-exporting ATPase/Cu+-exporting ATPase